MPFGAQRLDQLERIDRHRALRPAVVLEIALAVAFEARPAHDDRLARQLRHAAVGGVDGMDDAVHRYSFSAMQSASISTSHPFSTRPFTSTKVLAGFTLPNISPCAFAASRQRDISVSITRVRITLSSVNPALTIASAMISRQRFVWPYISPGAAMPPSGAIGAVPDTATNGPTLTAR